jgi:hypothetical protein
LQLTQRHVAPEYLEMREAANFFKTSAGSAQPKTIKSTPLRNRSLGANSAVWMFDQSKVREGI